MKIHFLLIVLIVAFTLATACIAQENPQPILPVQATINQILENPTNYENQSVELTGTITSQCGSGCWFIMSDKTGDMYVTLKPNDFVIPPALGKEVSVNGTISIKDNDVALIGSSVLLDGKTYP
jgi:uncharacterized protein YdeI (BOF family)